MTQPYYLNLAVIYFDAPMFRMVWLQFSTVRLTADLGETVARASLSEPDVLAILAQAGVDARS